MVGNAPKPARFEETQRLGQNRLVRTIMVIEPVFLGLLFLVLGLSTAQVAWRTLLIVWLAIAIATPLAVMRLGMRTRVTDHELLVRWSWFYRKRVALRDIERAEPIRYDAISQAGGWGIKPTRKLGLVLNVYGDRGVQITTTGGKRLMIGTQRSEELAIAVLEGSLDDAEASRG